MARKDQKGFLDLNNSTDRSEALLNLYLSVYPTQLGWEALIPFEQAKERNFRITRKKPIEFTVTTGEELGKLGKVIEKYTKPEYVEVYVTIEKAFSIGREYPPLEVLTPDLMRADLNEIISAERTYKRKAFLDMVQKEAPKLEYTVTDLKKEIMEIHDKLVDYAMEVGMNVNNLWIFSSIDVNRAFRDKLQLQIGASPQIQAVIDGKNMILNGIMSSVEGINYVGIPKKVSALGPDGTPQKMKLLDEDVLLIAVEMNTEFRPFIAKVWIHTPLRIDINPVGNNKGAVPILEFAEGYDVMPVEPLKMVVMKNVPAASKDINDYLTTEKLNLGEVADDNAAKTAAQAVIDGIAELKGKVTLMDPAQNKIHVKANDSTLKGEADFVYTTKAENS